MLDRGRDDAEMSDGRGEDWDRECMGERGMNGEYGPVLLRDGDRLNAVSSKASTWTHVNIRAAQARDRFRLTPFSTSIASSMKSLPLSERLSGQKPEWELVYATILLTLLP